MTLSCRPDRRWGMGSSFERSDLKTSCWQSMTPGCRPARLAPEPSSGTHSTGVYGILLGDERLTVPHSFRSDLKAMGGQALSSRSRRAGDAHPAPSRLGAKIACCAARCPRCHPSLTVWQYTRNEFRLLPAGEGDRRWNAVVVRARNFEDHRAVENGGSMATSRWSPSASSTIRACPPYSGFHALLRKMIIAKRRRSPVS